MESDTSPSTQTGASTCPADGIWQFVSASEEPLGSRILLMANVQPPGSTVGSHLMATELPSAAPHGAPPKVIPVSAVDS